MFEKLFSIRCNTAVKKGSVVVDTLDGKRYIVSGVFGKGKLRTFELYRPDENVLYVNRELFISGAFKLVGGVL